MNINSIDDLSRAAKRAIFLAVDSLLVPIALYCAFALRYGTATPWMPIVDSWVLFPVLTMWGVGIIWALRLHRIKLNAFDTHSMANIALAALFLTGSAIIPGFVDCRCFGGSARITAIANLWRFMVRGQRVFSWPQPCVRPLRRGRYSL